MSSPQHEPTMEEILASIRKIISEDSPEAAPPTPSNGDGDVLELTQEVVEAPAPAPAPEPVAAPAPAPKVENDVVFETPAPQPANSSAHDGIFSDTTRKAMDDTFATIPDDEPAQARRSAEPLSGIDGASVEAVFERAVRESFEPVLVKYLGDNTGMVIDRMKPVIREWMDEHFPALLEGAVRAEVERVVKARGAKR